MAKTDSENPTNKITTGYIDGKWQCKNLAFLVEFMQAAHLTTAKLAERTGYTRQCIFFWLKTDNASLKKIENVFYKLGYKLEMELVKDNIVRPAQNTFITLAEPDNSASTNLNTCTRLMFMVKAMAKNNFNIMDIVRRTGMTRSTVAHWFNTDDILVGNIFAVAEAFDLTVNTKISPLEETTA